MSHYFDSDLVVAGMSPSDHGRFFSAALDLLDNWKLMDIPASGPYEPFEGILSCVGRGHEILSASSF